MFKLLNGLYYSEHFLKLDHDEILQEVLMAKVKDDVMEKDEDGVYLDGGWDNYNLYPKNHTYSEDMNLYPKTIKKVGAAIKNELTKIFGQHSYFKLDERECWGHICEPGEQTMLHNHTHGPFEHPGLSFVYYPNFHQNAGPLIFSTQVNQSQYQAVVEPKRGMALIFSSEILHHTPPNSRRFTRESISGNFECTKNFKNILEEDEDLVNPFWKYTGKIDN